jgi:flagellar hook-associated protein 2
MSAINLGSFNTKDGKTSGLGFVSGLDSATLIDGILQPQADAIKAVSDSVDVNNTKITEVGNLRTLLDRLKTTVDFLRSPPGVGNANNDFFKHTTASLTSSTSIAASNYLLASTEAGASLNSYSITNIVKAYANQIRRDGFTSQTASVVGNLSITDNYQVSLGTVSGNVLNSATPITFANDVQGVKASVDVVFGDQNAFGATDRVVFGATTITFGGVGGNDIDISGAATVAQKVTAIANRLNAVTTGEESKYTYIANGTTLTVRRDVDGSNAEVGSNLAISADFSVDAGNLTQTVKIGSAGALNVAPGGALNSLGTDGNRGTVATNATMDLIFGTQNEFDATDSVTFGGTTITFGGTGGNDIDISSATTLDQKLDAIVARMNAVATGPENTYTYTRSSTGVITITQDTAGTIASTGNDMTVTGNFSTGTGDTTQTFAIGKNYQNNGSVAGSVARSNGAVSGTVSQNGVDGRAGARKATINVQFANNNIDPLDSLTFGFTTLTFGGGGGNDIALGANLPATLVNIANRLNAINNGPEAGYTYTSNGVDSIIVTRNIYGDSATINNTLAISANLFSDGANDVANTVKIGSAAATNAAQGPLALNTYGTDGVNQTSVSDSLTTHISTLSGAITLGTPTYIAGSATATSFTPNSIEFKATIGGVSYTSRPVILDGGSISGGTGTNTFGNKIAAGTVITFVKDTDGDSTPGTKDVTFQLVVGDEKLVDDAAGAATYAGEINTWLNTTNSITVGQNPTVPPLREGTFNLGGVNITLNAGDNLQVIKSKINAVSTTSGVQAEIVQVSDTSFSLVLKSTETGLVNKIFEFSDGDAGDGTAGTIQLGNDNVSFTLAQTASDASFTLDGQTITRASNTINDVISKVTFTIVSDTPVITPPTITVGVTSDTSIIKSGITDFINAYNELKFYVAKQTERGPDNKLVKDAILGDESILSDLMNSLSQELTKTVAGLTGGNPDTLFKVGINVIDFPGNTDTPATKDIFVIDDAKFDAALAANFTAFRDVFTYTFASNSPELGVFSHTNKTTLTNFVLDIDASRPTGTQVRVLDPTTNAFLFYADATGHSITGKAGTSLEGLVMVYTGDGTDLITVRGTKGIADSVYNLMDSYLKKDGVIDTKVANIQDDNTSLQDRIDRDTASMEAERALLTDQFTQLEAIISAANDTLSFLDSQRASDSANN